MEDQRLFADKMEMTATSEIDIARRFTKYPAGRFRSDGRYSGEVFREDVLAPELRNGMVEVIMDGTMGYGSSFLEEAFGGLVRIHEFCPSDLRERLVIKTADKLLHQEIWSYIDEAAQLKNGSRDDA